uniref:zinc ribbon domain-containing protein n=1 Tax=Nostoc linckia TaxID=92942 RepID=UPI0036F1B106
MKNRTYKCQCGFEFHRNGVGSINICKKYLGCFYVPVLGVMASPTGLRFHPHLQCNSVQAQQDAQRKNPLAVFNGENLNFFP